MPDDDREERIRRRAYEIWERDGQLHDDHKNHWHRAAEELDREDSALGARPSAIPSSDVPKPSSRGRKAKSGTPGQSDVEAAENLAIKTGITGDQAEGLIDRQGLDPEDAEQVARNLKAADD